MKMENKKILIGCPTANFKEYCLDEYIKGLKNLSYPNFDLIVVDNSKTNDYFETLKKKINKEAIPNAKNIEIIKDEFKERARDRIVSSRNIIRQKVLDGKYDCFLSLEQDIVAHKDIIERLLDGLEKIKEQSNKEIKIITAVYFNNQVIGLKQILAPLVYVEHFMDKTGMMFIPKHRLLEGKIIPIKACGIGCILIHRDVLEKVKFRYEGKGFDDMMFCKDSIEKGFDIWCDCSLIVEHFPGDWTNIEK